MKKIYTLVFISIVSAIVLGGCRAKKTEDARIKYALKLLENDEYESARIAFDEASLDFTNSITVYYNLGFTCWKLGDNDAAITALTKAVDLDDGSDARPLELLAYVLIDSGNAPDAGKVLSNIETPTASSLTFMALASEKAGSSDLARSYLGQALDLDAQYPPALYDLALLYRDFHKNSDEAFSYFKKFKTVAPNNIRADQSPEAFVGMGQIYEGTESVEPTPTTGQEPIINATPAGNQGHQTPRPAAELIEKAKLAIDRDNTDVALITLKSAVSKYPDSADAVWALAELYGKTFGNKEKANELYKKFVVMFPNDSRAAEAKSNVISGSFEATTKTDVDAGEKTAEGYFKTGLEYYNNKEWKKSVSAYTKGLRLEPRSSRIAYNLGLAYKAKGNLDKAAKAFTLALHINPDKTNALYMLGLTEMKRGNNDLALIKLNRILRLNPDFAAAHYLLGRIYSEENRPDMTVVHFKRFLRLAPNDRNANQVRVWLEQNKGSQE